MAAGRATRSTRNLALRLGGVVLAAAIAVAFFVLGGGDSSPDSDNAAPPSTAESAAPATTAPGTTDSPGSVSVTTGTTPPTSLTDDPLCVITPAAGATAVDNSRQLYAQAEMLMARAQDEEVGLMQEYLDLKTYGVQRAIIEQALLDQASAATFDEALFLEALRAEPETANLTAAEAEQILTSAPTASGDSYDTFELLFARACPATAAAQAAERGETCSPDDTLCAVVVCTGDSSFALSGRSQGLSPVDYSAVLGGSLDSGQVVPDSEGRFSFASSYTADDPATPLVVRLDNGAGQVELSVECH